MKRFDISPALSGDCVISNDARAGELYHVQRNSAGGTLMTPIARYFIWRPEFIEGFNRHWRVDCFVREHKLAPPLKLLREVLVPALKKEGLCNDPVWLSLHQSQEIEGRAYGTVFEDDDGEEKTA